MRNVKLILILSVLVSLFSCEEDEPECYELNTIAATKVNAPATAKVNEEVNVEVVSLLPQACGWFEKFTESKNNNTRTIEVKANTPPCGCPDLPKEETATYKFVTPIAGLYELKFKTYPTPVDSFITVLIDVK